MRRVPLRDIAAPIRNAIVDGPFGSNLKLINYVEQGVPVLQGKNITKDRFKWFDVRFISTEKAEELGRSKVREGDLLIVKIGSIGYSAIVDDLRGFPFAIIPANLAKVTLNKEVVFPKFIAQYLASPVAKRTLISLASKTAQPALSLTKIKELPVPLPPLPIQKQIAAILEKADAAREKRREANQLTEQFLQSAFLEMFGDYLNETRTCPWKTTKDAAHFIDYRGKTPRKSESGVRLITAKNVKKGYLSEDPKEYIVEDDYEEWMTRGFPQENDVLFTTEGPLGNVAKLGKFDKVVVGQRIITLRCGEGLTADYLMFCLMSKVIQGQILRRSTGSTVKGIRSKEFAQVEIPVPSLMGQQQFATLVEKVERLRGKQRESERELETLFGSLMQKAFTGELTA